MAVVGVDACKGGWVGIVLRPDRAPSGVFGATISALASEVPDGVVFGIDIPIGLPSAGRRQADLLARGAVGPRWQSVFFTPIRAALEASTHAEASAISVEATGGGISQQAYALRTKLFEVEA